MYLSHLLVTFFLVMTALCACGRNFPNDTAIAIHQKVCRQASSGFLNILKRKREAEDQKKLRKRQRREALAAEAVAREQAAAEAPPEFEVRVLFLCTYSLFHCLMSASAYNSRIFGRGFAYSRYIF